MKVERIVIKQIEGYVQKSCGCLTEISNNAEEALYFAKKDRN